MDEMEVSPDPLQTQAYKLTRFMDGLISAIEARKTEVVQLRSERNALAAALDENTHDYVAMTFGDWEEGKLETYDQTVELCGKCRQTRDLPRHRTSRVVLAEIEQEEYNAKAQ